MRPPDLEGPILTLWRGGEGRCGWEQGGAALVREARIGRVELHGALTPELAQVADAARRLGVEEVSFGLGLDGVARRAKAGLLKPAGAARWLVGQCEAAHAAGARRLVLDPEAQYKAKVGTPQRALLEATVRAMLDAAGEAAARLGLVLGWTGQDHPHFHASYLWELFLGAASPITEAWPQVYGAPEGGAMAHRGALPRREERHLASWLSYVGRGRIREDVRTVPDPTTDLDVYPYLQGHSVPAADTIGLAVRHPQAKVWAAPTRLDAEGREALLCLARLWRLGYWGEGAVRAAQIAAQAAGFDPGPFDDEAGPRTRAALARLDAAQNPA